MDNVQMDGTTITDAIWLKLSTKLSTISSPPSKNISRIPNIINKVRNSANIVLIPFEKVREARSYTENPRNPLCVRSVVNNAENIFGIDLPTAANAIQFQKVIKKSIASGEVKGEVLNRISDMRDYTSGLLFTTSRQRPKYGHVAKWFRDMSGNLYVIETELREISSNVVPFEKYVSTIGKMRRKMTGLIGLQTSHIALANLSNKNETHKVAATLARSDDFGSHEGTELAISNTSSAVSRYTVALDSGVSKKLSRMPIGGAGTITSDMQED